MASRPTVRWNESAGRWMAWVRFLRTGHAVKSSGWTRPCAEGSRRVVALRRSRSDPVPRRERLPVVCRGNRGVVRGRVPERLARRPKSRHAPREVAQHDRQRPPAPRCQRDPGYRKLKVDRTSTERLEELSAAWPTARWPPARSTTTGTTSTGAAVRVRQRGSRRTRGHGSAPERRPPTRTRKSFTIEQAERPAVHAIPARPQAGMWLTGLNVRSPPRRTGRPPVVLRRR